MSRQVLLPLLLAAIICRISNVEASDKRMRIQRDDVVGTWIGLTSDEMQMIRLSLEHDGTGLIGFSYLNDEPCVFHLAAWTFDKGKITLKLDGSPAKCPLDREFHCVVSGNALDLTMQGSGWKRSASLRREESLADRWRRLRATMSPR
jgi:hypothetical protein